MTDEAMNVAADAAPVSTNAPVDNGAQTNAPEISQQPERDTSARGAIDRAFEALNKREQTGTDVTTEPTGQRERNPDGTFKAVEKATEPAEKQEAAPTATAFEAPSRFSADAKAAWASAPEPVKAEVNRAIKELEGGIQQYQAAFEPYKDFDRQLKANGQTFQEVVGHYTGIEQLLREDPIKGLDQISRNLGYSLRQIAEHVMGQPADAQGKQNDTYINELKAEIADLKKQVGGVTTQFRSQQEKALLDQVEAFAADPANSRFQELATDIQFFLGSGRANDLKEAYDLAARLNPAAAPIVVPQTAAPAAQQTDPSQTRKGQLSPSGAPSGGSNPTVRKPSASAREALDRAFEATAGL
jgi:hypothetical protein